MLKVINGVLMVTGKYDQSKSPGRTERTVNISSIIIHVQSLFAKHFAVSLSACDSCKDSAVDQLDLM